MPGKRSRILRFLSSDSEAAKESRFDEVVSRVMGGCQQPKCEKQGDESQNRETAVPLPGAEAEHRQQYDFRSDERRYGLDYLAGRHTARQNPAVAHQIAQQRVERDLQHGIAHAEQYVGRNAGRARERDQRQEHPDDRHRHTQQDRALAAPAVHEVADGDSEKEEPDEYHRRDEAGHGRRPAEGPLHVIGRNADNVTEPHHEECRKDRDDSGDVDFFHRLLY